MNPTVTVIVPAYNASATIALCLNAILAESDAIKEVIVVNDCSPDSTAEIAAKMGVKVMQTPKQSGPAAARNLGAEKATGEILFFVDADVVLKRNSIALIREIFAKNHQLAAVFGSYDDQPSEKNFLSQYKNLLHHFVHQNSDTDAGTFWAGCGAIKREIFASLNGFNSQWYPHPSIEDIELGIRLKKSNHSILLEKRLQGKHLKKWTILSLLKADILYRAFPWSRLISEMGKVPNQLNLQMSSRISAIFALLFFGSLLTTIFFPSRWVLSSILLSLGFILLLNRRLYRFFLHKKGFLFLTGAIFWHMLYYVYSVIVFVLCWIRFRLLHAGARTSIPATIEMAGNEKR